MTQQSFTTNQKINLFEYFGVEVFFLCSDFQPLVVYGGFQSRKSKIIIQLENGVYSHLTLMTVDDCEPLDDKELDKFKKVVSNNLTEIIRSWTNHFVYHKEIQFEKIIKPII